MHAVARRRFALLAIIVVAVGVHVLIILALPKGRAPVVLTSAAVVVPSVPAPQIQAFVPSVATPPVAVAPPQVARAPKAAAVRVARKAPAPRDDNATIDMRPHVDDEAPIRIATPLPVTIVMPPSNAR
jgi:hypothetical protein